MKRLMVLAVGAAMMLGAMGGCTGSIPARQDVELGYPQVRTTSYWLAEWVHVQKPIASRVGTGQVQVDMDVRNRTNHRVRLDARCAFKEGGRVVEQTGWHQYLLEAQDSTQIHFTSIGPIVDRPGQPADFAIELRELH